MNSVVIIIYFRKKLLQLAVTKRGWRFKGPSIAVAGKASHMS
jgi:hypothetical protein